MNRGPKLKNPETKKLAGTYKHCLDGDTHPFVELVKDVPTAPLFLSEGGREIWEVDLPRVVKCGATDVDSHLFAIYCEMMARFVASAKSGNPFNAASVSELRKQMEMLGIAGPKARLARMGDAIPASNPFARFKK